MGGDNANSISEFEPVSPPADLHSSPSSPATQFLQGTADSAIDAAVGTAHLIADSAKAAYDIATTPEGKDAAWETAKSMLNDAAQFAKDAFSLTPIAPQEWQDDAKQRFQEWLINKADEFDSEREAAQQRGEEPRFWGQKIGLAVIGLFAKKVAPVRGCVQCAGRRGPTTWEKFRDHPIHQEMFANPQRGSLFKKEPWPTKETDRKRAAAVEQKKQKEQQLVDYQHEFKSPPPPSPPPDLVTKFSNKLGQQGQVVVVAPKELTHSQTKVFSDKVDKHGKFSWDNYNDPIRVKINKSGQLEIIEGMTRWQNAKKWNVKEIPVLIVE